MFKSLFNKAKEFFVGAPKVQPIPQEDKVTPVMEAPYKIEAPVVAAPVAPVEPVAVSKPKKAEKKPAAKKTAVKKRAPKKTTKA